LLAAFIKLVHFQCTFNPIASHLHTALNVANKQMQKNTLTTGDVILLSLADFGFGGSALSEISK